MKKITIFLLIIAFFFLSKNTFSYTLPTYTPEKYYLLGNQQFPIDIRLLQNKTIVKKIILRGLKYSELHKNNLKNYINITSYSFLLWLISPQGNEKALASKIGLEYSRKALILDPENSILLYLHYVLKDLSSTSYREIHGANKVLKIISKYKKMIKDQKGCVLGGGPYRNLARVYFKISIILPMYLKRSEELIYQAIKCDNNFPLNYLVFGDMYLLKGDFKNAKKIFDQAINITPKTHMMKFLSNISKIVIYKELKLYKEGKWNIRTDWVYDLNKWIIEYNNKQD